MSKNINARIALKRDTSANWTNHNPVLLNGELILVDTAEGQLRAKIGDGIKTYTQLPFTDEALRALITDVDNNNSAVVVTKNGESRLLDTFNIIKLTQAEYEELEASNSLNPDALYLTEGEDNQKADTAISYTPQTLTAEQKLQARTNIGAGQPLFVVNVTTTLSEQGEEVYTADKTAAEIETAYQEGCEIVCRMSVPIIGMGLVPVQLPLASRRGRQIFMFAINQTMWTDKSSRIVSYLVTIADDGVSVGQNNTEIYIKPTSGIPKTDLEQSVQTSLDKADTAISYTPQTLTEEQQEQARVNIGAFPERVIKQFWSNDHSVADIRDITTRTRYNFISYRGDDCNLNGVIINKEIVFPCLVLSVENYTDQVRNLVILDGAGRTLDMTIHNIHGVVGYHWHDPILRTWTDEQEPI